MPASTNTTKRPEHCNKHHRLSYELLSPTQSGPPPEGLGLT
ncbi:MAG: hypothetical protein ACK583_18315 [Cyanobacteriota bacterium]